MDSGQSSITVVVGNTGERFPMWGPGIEEALRRGFFDRWDDKWRRIGAYTIMRQWLGRYTITHREEDVIWVEETRDAG